MTEFNIEDYDILKYQKEKYQEYSHNELALFVQEAQKIFYAIRIELFDNSIDSKTADDVLKELMLLKNKKYESDIIMKHWMTLQKHFEENPTLKEEWDALCMGIKLTEDYD